MPINRRVGDVLQARTWTLVEDWQTACVAKPHALLVLV